MKLIRLAWKNVRHDGLRSLLSVLLMGMGLALVSFILITKNQYEEGFRRNMAGVHLVLGAKGSPLQMVLCNLYHADVPTGNIKISDASAFLNPKHPLIGKAVPLLLGDSYKSHRIVGTTESIYDLYGLEMAEGRSFERDMEAVIGANLGEKLSLKVGDKIQSSHGLGIEEDMTHAHEGAIEIVGILASSGTVVDELILIPGSTVWALHDEHDHKGPSSQKLNAHNHEDHHHAHEHHDHAEEDAHDDLHAADNKSATIKNVDLLQHKDKDITSMLLTFKAKNARTLNLLRNINEKTPMMAASPSFQLNQLFQQLGVGIDLLKWIAWLILLISALSIWFSMTISLQDRRYELALIRSFGASRMTLALVIWLEAVIIGLVSFVLAVLLLYFLLDLFSNYWASGFSFGGNASFLSPELIWMFFVAMILATISVIIPLVKTLGMDVSEVLSRN